MGCDIHTSLMDVLRRGLERPRAFAIAHEVLENRNYRLFAVLAGVRGTGSETFIEPRGLPDWWDRPSGDDDYMHHVGANSGDHSHSWLTIPELRAVAERYEPYPSGPDGYEDNTRRAILALCDYAELYASGEPVLVFSFDN